MKEAFLLFCKLLAFALLIFGCNTRKTESLSTIDGPYIFSEKDGLTVVTLEKDSDSVYYLQRRYHKRDIQEFSCNVGNTDNDSFSFTLMAEHKIPRSTYESKEKIFATSDIEGNFNAFYSLLVGNKVMNSDFKWTFGTGHLVIVGDMFDRGNDVIPCLWLLYKLEQEAVKAGGQAHYILGNHDVMNIQNDLRYVQPKYIELAKILSEKNDAQEAYRDLMSNNNILVQRIKSKNTVEKIGNTLFLHGGISQEITDASLSISQINDLIREHIQENLYKHPGSNKMANLTLGRLGPLWYRGMVKDYKDHYKKLDQASIDFILQFYDVDHIVIGHTIVDDRITADFHGKVIRIDMKHQENKFTGKSEALFIENGSYFMVNDQGEQVELEFAE